MSDHRYAVEADPQRNAIRLFHEGLVDDNGRTRGSSRTPDGSAAESS